MGASSCRATIAACQPMGLIGPIHIHPIHMSLFLTDWIGFRVGGLCGLGNTCTGLFVSNKTGHFMFS